MLFECPLKTSWIDFQIDLKYILFQKIYFSPVPFSKKRGGSGPKKYIFWDTNEFFGKGTK